MGTVGCGRIPDVCFASCLHDDNLYLPDQILLVDDDVELRELVATALRAHSYVVEVASDAAQAMERSLNQEFDAVITDILFNERQDRNRAVR